MKYVAILLVALSNCGIAEAKTTDANSEESPCGESVQIDAHGVGPDAVTSAEACFTALNRMCGRRVSPVTIYHRSTHYFNDQVAVYTYCFGLCPLNESACSQTLGGLNF